MSLVRMVHIAPAPGKAQAVEALLRELVPAIEAREGCEGATAFLQPEPGAYGLFVRWDTLAHADAAAAVIGPRLQRGLQGNVQEPPDIAMFEVVEAALEPPRAGLLRRTQGGRP